jgi:hypothetical protein
MGVSSRLNFFLVPLFLDMVNPHASVSTIAGAECSGGDTLGADFATVS